MHSWKTSIHHWMTFLYFVTNFYTIGGRSTSIHLIKLFWWSQHFLSSSPSWQRPAIGGVAANDSDQVRPQSLDPCRDEWFVAGMEGYDLLGSWELGCADCSCKSSWGNCLGVVFWRVTLIACPCVLIVILVRFHLYILIRSAYSTKFHV
jgi:hypothetical protein